MPIIHWVINTLVRGFKGKGPKFSSAVSVALWWVDEQEMNPMHLEGQNREYTEYYLNYVRE